MKAFVRDLLAAWCCLAVVGSAQTEREVRVPLVDGRVSLLELSRHVFDAYGYEGDALRFPDLKVPMRGVRGGSVMFAIDRALGDAVDLGYSKDKDAIVLRIDHTAMRVLRHETKQKFGRWLSKLTGEDVLARDYELLLPDEVGPNEPYVICVHGVDSSPAVFADLRQFLREGSPSIDIGTFRYANDEAIDRIGTELANRLRRLRRAEPERRVVLVAHSMGGLVSRFAIEHPDHDPGNVDSLVMIGTPNHGSRLSRLRSTVDVAQFLRELDGRPELVSKFVDGLGEAGWDMWPGSVFLTELNSRPRNPKVSYRLVLGDQAAMTPAARDAMRDRVIEKVPPLVREKLRGWIDDLDEVIVGAGDGAVSLARGRLEGVEEVVVPLGHRALIRASPDQPVFALVREWLGR